MRIGLRLRVLFALGALCVVAFLPLYFAVTSLARTSLRAERDASARALGRELCAEGLASLSRGDAPQSIVDAIAARTPGLVSYELFDSAGTSLGRAGERPALTSSDTPRLQRHAPASSRAVEVASRGPEGAAVALVRAEERAEAPLVSLVGFYTAGLALSLLVFSYIAVTRLVVRPLDALSRAARRVASGARRLDAPSRGAPEIVDLGASIAAMTASLVEDERALRAQLVAIEEANSKLRDAHAQLLRSERLASVGRLAAGLAHEVGNPLAALLGLEDLLLAGGSTHDEERDFLVRMRAETERIYRIVRDLLDFARPASPPDQREPEPPGDVGAAVHDVVSLLRPQRDLRETHLAIDVARDLPLVSLGHGPLVQTVLNLLLNAADAAGPTGTIFVRARADEQGVLLEIEDNGPGIDPSIAPVLFEPFVTTKPVGTGTGLGLAVCRGLVEGAGGSISTSARGAGARGALFRIRLPRAISHMSSGMHT